MFVLLSVRCPAHEVSLYVFSPCSDCTHESNLRTTVKASPSRDQKTLPNVRHVSAQAKVTARRLPLLLPAGLHKIVPGDKMQPVNPVLNCNQACTTVMGEKHTMKVFLSKR